MNFWMLSKIRLPSFTARGIDAKLSSSKTMSLACLATSVPLSSIEMPTSALFRASASFTPSPVMATRYFCFNISRILNLWKGETLAKMLKPESNFSSSSLLLILSSSSPLRAPPVFNSISLAIAFAVIMLSPVIIITRMPAFSQDFIACFTSFLGGSFIACSPSQINFSSLALISLTSLKANPKTLSDWEANSLFFSSIFFLVAVVRFIVLPLW